MAALYTAFLSGTVTDNPLAIGATTLNAAALASMPAVVAPDYMWLALDPAGANGAPELVKVTAHTALATSCTITRGQQTSAGGGPARAHPQNTLWVHTVSPDDLGRGTVLSATTSGADQSGITTEADITGLTLTTTTIAGHRYRVCAAFNINVPALSLRRFPIQRDGVAVYTAFQYQAGSFTTVYGVYIDAPSAGSHTYKVRASSDSSTVTIANTTSVGLLTVEDIGP